MMHQLASENYPKTFQSPDGSPLVLRPMTAGDRQPLWQFFQHVPEEDHMFLKHDVARLETIEAWCTHIDYNKVLPLLAWKGQEIIADATLHQDRAGWTSHIGHVRIVVGPDYRGRGVGNRLLRELIELATLSNLEFLDAEFMAEQHRAIESFLKLGFKQLCVMPRRVHDRKMQYHDLVLLTYDLKEKRDGIGAEAEAIELAGLPR
jgi:L-amino acid N-acyltransferase YncA